MTPRQSPTDLAQHIQETTLIDTHEHLNKENDWLFNGPGDVLADLFSNYVQFDLISAGASPRAITQLTDASAADIETRWRAVEKAWSATRLTGYGRAVRTLAKHVYDIDEITPGTVAAAQPRLEALRQGGQRLHLLRDRARIDQVQTDDKCWACVPDLSGLDFFLYDISWVGFCARGIAFEQLTQETQVTVKDLATLKQAMEVLFEKYGPCAIAVKSQHAYNRTLRWSPPDDAEAERQLQTILTASDTSDVPVPLVLGDWSLARGVELAIEHNLPFKIHTGSYAGNYRMPVERIRPGHLCPLLARYPDARFVLMHIGYPYQDELIALAKHYPNVYVDLCWAWSLDPYASSDFVRQFLHAAPANKLFGFGGDTHWPTSTYAYSIQMRHNLTKALEAEVATCELTETEAIDVATRLMRDNQRACFDIEGTRSAIRDAAGSMAPGI